MDFCEIWCLSIFPKSIVKILVLLKSDKNNGCFTWRPMYFFIKSCWILRTMFQTQDVQKVITCILYIITFFQTYAVFEIFWKNMLSQTGYRWQYNKAHVHFMLDNRLQTLTPECVILGGFHSSNVLQTCLSVMLYIHCLCFKVVHSKHFLDHCTQFISPTKWTVLIIYKY